jgi:pyruvate,water dikinase
MKKRRRQPVDKLLDNLRERAKELDCLYRIEELLKDPEAPLDKICSGIVAAVPPGWQFSNICVAKLVLSGEMYASPGFKETEWMLKALIRNQKEVIGAISVYYTEEMPSEHIGPFLKEEQRLIATIADRIGHFINHRQTREMINEWEDARQLISRKAKAEWQVVLDLLRQTDKDLFLIISHKMLNHLCWTGKEKAESLRAAASIGPAVTDEELVEDVNLPHKKQALMFSEELSDQVFALASESISDEEIFDKMQKWIQEDKLSFLVQVVNRNLPLSEVADAIRRYYHTAAEERGIFSPNKKGIEVSLIRRFLSDQLSYIKVAKNHVEIADLHDILRRVIYASESHGKLGGKAAGLVLATQILRKSRRYSDLLHDFRTPKTWHITSDMLLQFMHYNSFDEVVEQKYKDIDQVRLEYPHVVRTFKDSHFPVEVIQGLSLALDDFGDRPLIVRSSSLLEDRAGSAFSGKYKSLFLANRGSKEQRIEALTDAIAEVYASTFGPDPIEYRAERGLLDFGEEMAIMIQEVVGNQVGKYYLPTFAGVAFSRNEFRWSPRIRKEDGLIRMVPGLGTRAVDRTSSDYPILVAPGQPGLRVNMTVDETVRYSPSDVDVINLERNCFETIPVKDLLREIGDELPGVDQVFSIAEDDRIRPVSKLGFDPAAGNIVATFDGLIERTSFVDKVHSVLQILEDELGTPVDIEFASDGKNFYLLQCRPQCYSSDAAPAAIPRDIVRSDIIFTANKYVSNGTVEGITHMVYVDPVKYGEVSERSSLVEIGRAVGKLNRVLPKRKFVLMGPGRWGSRGDIRLGVSVTYSDISNTAMLIEIAKNRGGYVPDLSFGTHFFQDLVESNVRYLPLYPDEDDTVFNESFMSDSPNILPEILSDYSHLADVLRVIDIERSSNGKMLRVLMNSDTDEAVGYMSSESTTAAARLPRVERQERQTENHWGWRLRMAERIATELDPSAAGVAALYVIGSTKNGTAGPASDIDLVVHFRGTDAQKERLECWFDAWSGCLDEVNYMRTGYRTGGLLDVHYLTDEDIASKTSYAVKIGAATDPARRLDLGSQS